MSQLDNPNVVAVNQPEYKYLGAGFSGFPFMSPCINGGGNFATIPTNNVVYVLQIVIPSPITVANAAINVSNINGATNFDMGLYDINGNLIFDCPFSMSSGSGNFIKTIATKTVQPGIYYYCWTGSGVGGSLFGDGGLDHDLCFIFFGMGTVTFTAANAATSGVLPATLGALTPVNLINDSTGVNVLPPLLFCMGA
jgi:hypothetical protein